MAKIEVVIADDHPLVRNGLRTLIENQKEFRVVSEANNGEEALEQIERLRPRIAVLDIAMPKLNGIDTARKILALYPETRVLMLTMHDDEAYLSKTIEIGAHGYVLKDADAAEIITALKRIAAGEKYFSPSTFDLAKKNTSADRKMVPGLDDAATQSLTAREKQILVLIAEGHSTPEIAKKLYLSPRTIDTHRSNIMHKLGIHQATGLVRFAIERGLVKPS